MSYEEDEVMDEVMDESMDEVMDESMDKSEYNENLNSWILYIIKEVMGVDEVRNEILKYYLQPLPQYNIEYGPTFSIGVAKAKLYKYLDRIISLIVAGEDKLVLFTCNNNYGPMPRKGVKLIETHYQTFIVQPQKKRITMIDPSRRRRQTGIYWPYAAMVVYFYIKARIPDCNFYWLKTTQPCQVEFSKYENNADVFCQSWSLYLQKQALLTNKTVIDIPFRIDDKYNLLINFYQEIIQNVPIFRDEFMFRWKEYLKKKKLPFANIDVLGYVLSMKGTDVYYKKDMISIKPESSVNYVNLVSKEEIDESLGVFINANPMLIDTESIDFLKNSLQRKSPIRHFIKTPMGEHAKSPENKRTNRRHSRSPRRSPNSTTSPNRSPRRSPKRSPSPNKLPTPLIYDYMDIEPPELDRWSSNGSLDMSQDGFDRLMDYL
jgi:hypothetical protein